MQKDTTTYTAALRAWQDAAPLRANRERNKQYTYGDQWSDIVDDGNGNLVTERDLVRSCGKRPQTNNLIRRLVKTIVGRYRTIASENSIYDPDPQSIDILNSLSELDARLLEEFVISGCAIQRIVAERRPGGQGVWIDNVNPRKFFVNRFTDPRGLDIDFIGMLHDMSWPEIVNRFAHGSRTRATHLRAIYDTAINDDATARGRLLGIAGNDTCQFDTSDIPGRMRVIEVWTLEGRQVVVRGRISMDMVWHCRWLAPDATLLDEYNSPFQHRSHPFVVTLYPLTDGEVHPFVEDVIDQQRAINRLVVLADNIMATSAKGALLFPIEQLPRGVSLQDIGRLWARPDAVIPITGRGNTQPTQVMPPANIGAPVQLLTLQMQLFDNISGVGDTLLGRDISPSTGANFYEAQVRNASTTLTDIFDTFTSHISRRTAKANATIRIPPPAGAR